MADELLVFDLGRVLVEVDFSRFARSLAQASGKTPQEALDAWTQGEPKGSLDRGLLGPWAFVEQLHRWAGARSPGPEALALAWVDIFGWLPGAREGLEHLAGRHELWLFSDTDPLHLAWVMERFELGGLFSRQLLSYARGRLKRDPGAFEVLGQEVARGRRVIFVDDLEINTRAAQQQGVEAILFQSWPLLVEGLQRRGLW